MIQVRRTAAYDLHFCPGPNREYPRSAPSFTFAPRLDSTNCSRGAVCGFAYLVGPSIFSRLRRPPRNSWTTCRLNSIEWVRCLAMGFLLESPVQLADSQVPYSGGQSHQRQPLFST